MGDLSDGLGGGLHLPVTSHGPRCVVPTGWAVWYLPMDFADAVSQIFKHHISVVEGHRKMVDMVRKHTVEGTGNFRTIDQMFKRANEMLFTSKQLERSFVSFAHQHISESRNRQSGILTAL